MDNQQAKFILQSCRAGVASADDPQLTEALREARHDPQLAGWLAHERALDDAISRQLKRVAVPLDLRERLLAGMPAPLPGATRHPRAALLALAAAVALLASLAALWFKPGNDEAATNLAAYQRQMRARVSGRVQFSFTAANVGEIQQWLASRGGLSGFTLPAALGSRPPLGCQTWNWNGRPVGLICFLLDDRQAVHLFVVDRGAVPDASVLGAARVEESNGWTTATWTAGDKLFLLMGKTDRESIEKLL